MKLILAVLFTGFSLIANAQAPGQEAPYKKNPNLPPFELVQLDNSTLTPAQLKKQNTLIMYFSPDCDHCIHQMEDMNKQMNDLKKLQILMVTNQPMEQLAGFVKKYKLAEHSNIRTARDVKFQLPPFYRMQSLPYFALYDKDGKLITTFESNTKVDTLLKAFAKK
jgi:thioredoxin-related protein